MFERATREWRMSPTMHTFRPGDASPKWSRSVRMSSKRLRRMLVRFRLPR